jgi:hypothetical protein
MSQESKPASAGGINWQSRKFLLTLIGMGMMIYLGNQGSIPWKEAASNLVWLVMFYVLGEGIADHGGVQRVMGLLGTLGLGAPLSPPAPPPDDPGTGGRPA